MDASMTTADATSGVVIPEAQMEQGMVYDDTIPVAATAVMAEPDHALTASNRFVPVATASSLPEHPPLSSSEDDEEEQRPDLLSATVHKSSPDSPVGIALMDNTDVGVTVRRIEPDGLFAMSSFQIGDRLISVNSESCEGLDSRGVADLIRKAEGIVTVIVRAPNGRADRVFSMVMKESPDARVGIGLKTSHGKLVVSSIAEDGIFAHSLLNVSDTCLSINGVACTSDTNATIAVELIQTSPSFVTITAKTKGETGIVVATSKESGPTVAYDSESAPPTPARTQVATGNKKNTCICGVIVFVILVIAIVLVVVITRDHDDYYYDDPCTYTDCRVCDRYCERYSKSFEIDFSANAWWLATNSFATFR